jgi:hypothetical protein
VFDRPKPTAGCSASGEEEDVKRDTHFINTLFSRYRVFEEINYKCLPQRYTETVWRKSANFSVYCNSKF